MSAPCVAQFTKVVDSGERESFKTGSVRDAQVGKGRFDLVPPEAMLRLAQHYENGAAKYGDRNWEKGQPVSRYISSAIRHLFKYLLGMRDEDHLAAVAWNVFSVMHHEVHVAAGNLPDELMDIAAMDSQQANKIDQVMFGAPIE